MSHWLDEAENKVNSRSAKKSEILQRVDIKKQEVKLNKEIIGEKYLDTIDQFVSIIQRINNLPRMERNPFGQIYSKQKENKLDNYLHKFYSSRRIIVREFSGILAPFKSQHYKNSRSFFISIGREKGHVLLEYKEIKAKRIRINDQIKGFWSFFTKEKSKDEKDNHQAKEKISSLPLSNIDKAFILNHIDWLAYKQDGDEFFK